MNNYLSSSNNNSKNSIIINLLPDHVLSDNVFQYLSSLERIRYASRTCRKWYRLCSLIETQHQQEIIWDDLLHKYNTVYPMRLQKRNTHLQGQQLSTNISLDISDQELSDLATALTEQHNNLTKSNIDRIIELLDSGAICSKLSDYELNRGCNLGYYMDCYLEAKVSETQYHTINIVWREMICSPCRALFTNRRYYAGSGGVPFPCFLFRIVIKGRADSSSLIKSFQERNDTYWTIRLMIHADPILCYQFMDTFHDQFHFTAIEELPSAIDIYFILRCVDLLTENTVMDWEFLKEQRSTLALFIFLYNPRIIQEWLPYLDIRKALTICWSTKSHQKLLKDRLKKNRALRLFLIDSSCLEYLCHRKDRTTIELLVHYEPQAMIHHGGIDRALLYLESVRGKKERLEEFLERIRDQARKKSQTAARLAS